MEDRGVYLVIGFTDEGRSFEYTQEKAQEITDELIEQGYEWPEEVEA